MRTARLKRILGTERIERIQRVFWIRVSFNYFITNERDYMLINPGVPCRLIPIGSENCHRVVDFRESERISQYQAKLARDEIGYFAEISGRMAGSIWATVNAFDAPILVRDYLWLNPGEALIHDIVTGEGNRGLGIGPFMTSRMAQALLGEYGVARIVIDVGTKNHSSNRMMDKIGLKRAEKVLYLTLWGGRAYRLLLQDMMK